MKKILTVCGTRPEFIKLEPILECLNQNFNSVIVLTNQHDTLLASLLQTSTLHIQHRLNNHLEDLSLSAKVSKILSELDKVIMLEMPDLILVQGDTLSSFVGALAGFYAKIDVAHVEAGLRTYNMHSPWPEEMHRTLITHCTKYHFAPTIKAKVALLRDGVDEDRIYLVGNTVIDAVRKLMPQPELGQYDDYIMITMHRREYFGKHQKNFCKAINILASNHPNIQFRFVQHPNPKAKQFCEQMLKVSNIILCDPLPYQDFIKKLSRAMFVITDSGGIQEEVAYLGKPVVIFREHTERMEGVLSGGAMLVGFDEKMLVDICSRLLEDSQFLKEKSIQHNAFGDGQSAARIVQILESLLL